MKHLKTKIISNERAAQDIYKISFEAKTIAGEIKAGQFFQIKCSDFIYPLLRRPFSVHRVSEGNVEIFYKIVGKGTELLSQKKAGESLDVVGPLGNGFEIKMASDTVILLSGGIGFAPILGLAEKVRHLFPNRKMYAFLGAESKKEILCARDFSQTGAEILITTEDGSLGKKGVITELFYQCISGCNPGDIDIYACGSPAMLKVVSQIAKEHYLNCQVSLEAHMACGTGVCRGCAVKTTSGYKLACKDGPVFDAKELEW